MDMSDAYFTWFCFVMVAPVIAMMIVFIVWLIEITCLKKYKSRRDFIPLIERRNGNSTEEASA